jgi:hypothetical protein
MTWEEPSRERYRMCNVPDEHGTQNNAKELTAFQYG